MLWLRRLCFTTFVLRLACAELVTFVVCCKKAGHRPIGIDMSLACLPLALTQLLLQADE